MRSSFAGLNTMLKGIYAQQASLDTVGHNITNAGTPGYSRQTVNLTASVSSTITGRYGAMQIGTGVDMQSITRVRDTYLDQQYWQENASLNSSQSQSTILSKIEGIFKDSDDSGLQNVINSFWTDLNTLASSASDDGTRTAVRERGVELVNTLTGAADKLKDLASDINDVLKLKTDSINQMTTELLSLNKQISSIEAGKQNNANDLRDRRDYIIDQLSTMMDVNVQEDQNSNYIVRTNGFTLVDGSAQTNLCINKEANSEYGYDKYFIGVSPTKNLDIKSGELKGYIDIRDSKTSGINAYLDKVNAMSQFLLVDFNNVHKAGYDMNNENGTNFFGSSKDYNVNSPADGNWIKELCVNNELYQTDGLKKIAAKTLSLVIQSNASSGKLSFGGSYTGSGTHAFSLKVDSVDGTGKITGVSVSLDSGAYASATIDSDGNITLPYGLSANIASVSANAVNDTYSFSLPPQGNSSGDNAINLANLLKNDISKTLDNSSLESYYSSLIGGLGVQSQNAARQTDNQKSLVDQITTWRESNSGVNIDEEMSNMIRYQNGYNAVARVMTTMDEMLDKLINSTGVVGR